MNCNQLEVHTVCSWTEKSFCRRSAYKCSQSHLLSDSSVHLHLVSMKCDHHIYPRVQGRCKCRQSKTFEDSSAHKRARCRVVHLSICCRHPDIACHTVDVHLQCTSNRCWCICLFLHMNQQESMVLWRQWCCKLHPPSSLTFGRGTHTETCLKVI